MSHIVEVIRGQAAADRLGIGVVQNLEVAGERGLHLLADDGFNAAVGDGIGGNGGILNDSVIADQLGGVRIIVDGLNSSRVLLHEGLDSVGVIFEEVLSNNGNTGHKGGVRNLAPGGAQRKCR